MRGSVTPSAIDLSTSGAVCPDAQADPVRAVLDAHASGALLALPTSGTTAGQSRRVVRTTDSWWSSFVAYAALSGVDEGARVWVPGPLSGTMNLFAAVHAATVGATVVSDPTTATHACLTPTALVQGLADLRPGTQITVAGAVLPDALADRAHDAGLSVWHYYGAAELSFVAGGSRAGALTAFPGVQLELRQEGESRFGTIWVRSPYLGEGYAGAPGALRRDADGWRRDERVDGRRRRGLPRRARGGADADGWATVGDLGELDAQGQLIVRGRPEAITTGGMTVVIADIEAALAPAATAEFAVHAQPHPDLGEIVAISLTNASDRPALEARAKTHLSAAQRPRVWHTVTGLPRTSAGKIDRLRLSETER